MHTHTHTHTHICGHRVSVDDLGAEYSWAIATELGGAAATHGQQLQGGGNNTRAASWGVCLHARMCHPQAGASLA